MWRVGGGGRAHRPERPTERASSKEGGTGPRTHPGPRPSSRGDSDKGRRRPESTHCTSAGGQQGGREGTPLGSSTLHTGEILHSASGCTGEITIGTRPVGPSVNGPGWFGRAGRLRPTTVPREQLLKAPRESRSTAPRKGSTNWSGGKGERAPGPGRGWQVTEDHDHPDRSDRPPLRGPFLHTLRAQIGSIFVEKC